MHIKQVVLIGYSGHGWVVAEALRELHYLIIGYLDFQPALINPFELEHLGLETEFDFKNHVHAFPGIGDNVKRKKAFEYCLSRGAESITIVHPEAMVSKMSDIDKGALVARGASVNPLAKIGKGAIINTNSVIEHECIVGDYVHIAPNTTLCGNVSIGTASFIGAGSVIKQGVRIGDGVTIGAGSVVLKDIDDGEVAFGNPCLVRNLFKS